MYDVNDIAKYIIVKCDKENHAIDNIRLNQILYLAQQAYLKDKGYKLFDNAFVVKEFGPIILDVYYRYCGYGLMLLSGIPYTDNIELLQDKQFLMDKGLLDKIIVSNRELAPREVISEETWWQVVNAYGLHHTFTDEEIVSINLIEDTEMEK